jgi:serine/threonine protein kinase
MKISMFVVNSCPQVNILVEESGRALLCDFGLSRMKADATSRTVHTSNTIIAGSRNWMAPELLAGSLPKMPSDIYSFGMTLFEVRIPDSFFFYGNCADQRHSCTLMKFH